jgi:hypothetical protein
MAPLISDLSHCSTMQSTLQWHRPSRNNATENLWRLAIIVLGSFFYQAMVPVRSNNHLILAELYLAIVLD